MPPARIPLTITTQPHLFSLTTPSPLLVRPPLRSFKADVDEVLKQFGWALERHAHHRVYKRKVALPDGRELPQTFVRPVASVHDRMKDRSMLADLKRREEERDEAIAQCMVDAAAASSSYTVVVAGAKGAKVERNKALAKHAAEEAAAAAEAIAEVEEGASPNAGKRA